MKINKTIEDGYFDILSAEPLASKFGWEVTIDFNGKNKVLNIQHEATHDSDGKAVSGFLKPGFCLRYLSDEFVYAASQADFEGIPNNFGHAIFEIKN